MGFDAMLHTYDKPSKTIAIIVGEASGDNLGAALIQALKETEPETHFRFIGLAGDNMQRQGASTLFDIEEISVMGISAVIPKIPMILKRINQVVDYLSAQDIDCLITIDSPDFTQRVAKKYHKLRPNVPIIGYVSPSVWAWRPKRAKKMAQYMTHLMALLPFEPSAHKRLGGPPCTYVGHPLLSYISDENTKRIREKTHLKASEKVNILLLPGSRRREIQLQMPFFKKVIAELPPSLIQNAQFILPTLAHRKDLIDDLLQTWNVNVDVKIGEDEKWRAFKEADGALAASGTVTLELGVMGVPTIAVYHLSPIESALRFLVSHLPSFILTNLVLEKNIVPEYIGRVLNAKIVAKALEDILKDGKPRNDQINGLLALTKIIQGDENAPPAQRAAKIVLDVIKTHKGAAGK